mmetsp:Transcript_14066/g.42540  ORF Transcript_14066/g.42540 Transcript_14066/m.42540 type:complete len:171 (+) Transcript_14066:74-586(+)
MRRMGCSTSKSKKRVYLISDDEDSEIRGKVEAFAKEGGIPVERLSAILDAVCAQKLDAGSLAAAKCDLDPAATGSFSVDGFCAWFRHHGDDDFAPPKHPIVAAGLKEDGDLGGSGLAWDVPIDDDTGVAGGGSPAQHGGSSTRKPFVLDNGSQDATSEERATPSLSKSAS